MELSRSDSAQILWFLATQLAIMLPLILVWLAGLIFTILNWRKHPKISTLVFVAILLFLLEAIAGILLSSLPFFRQLNAEQIGYIFFAAGIVRALISAVAFALLLLAVWSGHYSIKK